MNNLETAARLLQQQAGKIIKRSSLYETDAWGKTDQPDFLNQVLMMESLINAEECLQHVFSIENRMGRIRAEKNAPRIIDIDILFFNDEIINEPHLTLPHPQIQNRKFILVPMNELSPGLVHPVLHQTMAALLSTCKDELGVRLIGQP